MQRMKKYLLVGLAIIGTAAFWGAGFWLHVFMIRYAMGCYS